MSALAGLLAIGKIKRRASRRIRRKATTETCWMRIVHHKGDSAAIAMVQSVGMRNSGIALDET